MRAAVHGSLRLVPGTLRGRSHVRHTAGWLLSSLAALTIVAVMASNIVSMSSERRALRALPGEQRLVLLSRAVDELRQICGEGRPDGLKEHCRQVASLAAQLDECRGGCEELVRHQLTPAPRR